MKKLLIPIFTVCIGLTVDAAERPNVIFIYADDMGIGDVSHNGGKAATPHLDRMATEGMRFTDAHSTLLNLRSIHPLRMGLITSGELQLHWICSRIFILKTKPL